jgi:sugar phosphate permease
MKLRTARHPAPRPASPVDDEVTAAPVNGARSGIAAVSYGWWVVLSGTALMTLVGALSYYGMGVFFNALRDDLGWSAAALGAALSLARIQGGVLAPVVGVIIDRYGPRKLMIVGVLMTGAGFILLGQTMSLVYFYVVFIILVQGGISAGMGNAPSSAIVWAVGLPLAFVVRRPRPGDMVEGEPYQPETEALNATSATGAVALNSEGEVEFSPRGALRTKAFWSIALMFAARHFVTGSVALFLIPLLEERDMSLTDAATILSLMAFIGMPGRVGFAWLGDRIDKRIVIGLCLIFQSAGLILFTTFEGTIGIVAFLILYSPTYSGVLPLIPALQVDYFGRRWFATISGMMAPVTTVSVVAGPIFVTTVRDLTGSFQPAFVALAIVNVLALVFVVITRRPKLPGLAPV